MHVQSNLLLLAAVFENFRNMCLEIQGLDPAKFLSAARLAWQAGLKKTKVKLDLLTDIDMFLMVEKGIRGRACHSIYQYEKGNGKCLKDYNKNRESSYLQYCDVNNLYGCAMLQKLPVKNFKWVRDISKVDERFLKSYVEKSDKGYFLEVDIQNLKKIPGRKACS